MERSADLEFAIAEILSSGEVMLINDLLPGRGPIRAESDNVLVRGQASGRQHIFCARSVVVDTTIDAGAGTPGRIEAEGEVVISGSARNMHITARSIRIGGEARHCQLESLHSTVVEGDLIETRVALGDLGACKRLLTTFEASLRSMIEQREALNYQIQREAAKLHKACQSTRFNLNLGVGRLIQQGADGLHVDLSFFYEQIGKERERDVQAALIEFFNRGVIGVLARTNRPYYASSPANERLFVKALADLRKLVLKVRDRDLLLKRIEAEIRSLDELIDGFRDPDLHLCVHGRLYPGSSACFADFEVQAGADGHLELTRRECALHVRLRSDGLYLHEQYPDGRSQRTPIDGADLGNIRIGLGAGDGGPTLCLAPRKNQ